MRALVQQQPVEAVAQPLPRPVTTLQTVDDWVDANLVGLDYLPPAIFARVARLLTPD